MSYKTPTRGNMLQLWDKLSPDQGYSREEIEKIAKDNAIGDYTVGNLLNTRRKYLIFKKDTELYYRNDSAQVAQLPPVAKSSATTKPPRAKKAKSLESKSTTAKTPRSKAAIAKSPGSKSTKAKSAVTQETESPVAAITKLGISAESIAQKIYESTQRLEEAKLRKEKVTLERQKLETEEQSLNSEITELESSLQSIQLFL